MAHREDKASWSQNNTVMQLKKNINLCKSPPLFDATPVSPAKIHAADRTGAAANVTQAKAMF